MQKYTLNYVIFILNLLFGGWNDRGAACAPCPGRDRTLMIGARLKSLAILYRLDKMDITERHQELVAGVSYVTLLYEPDENAVSELVGETIKGPIKDVLIEQ